MPFLKEGLEPVKTITSINNTTNPQEIEIIAICDEPEYEHEDLINSFNNVKFIKNSHTVGIDASRSIGIHAATAPATLIIDGHMRFSRDDWVNKILEATKKEPTTLWCTKSLVLDTTMSDEELDPFKDALHKERHFSVGAEFHFNKDHNYPFGLIWLHLTTFKDKYQDNEVPCVLGANYASSTEWLKRSRLFEGLIGYGFSEQYASIKNWLLGGKCKGLEDVGIAHIFRKNRPYTANYTQHLYNMLFTAYTLFPDELDFYTNYINFIASKNVSNPQFNLALEMLEQRYDIVATYRHHALSMKTIKVVDMLSHLNINFEDMYNPETIE